MLSFSGSKWKFLKYIITHHEMGGDDNFIPPIKEGSFYG